jgi:predicted transcriptional regulator
MATTIQISEDLQKELSKRKLFDRESYEEVIWDILEDTMELSEQTKRDIEESRKQIKRGKFKTLEQVKKELGL